MTSLKVSLLYPQQRIIVKRSTVGESMLWNIGFYLTFRSISRIMRTIKTVKIRLELDRICT